MTNRAKIIINKINNPVTTIVIQITKKVCDCPLVAVFIPPPPFTPSSHPTCRVVVARKKKVTAICIIMLKVSTFKWWYFVGNLLLFFCHKNNVVKTVTKCSSTFPSVHQKWMRIVWENWMCSYNTTTT